MPASGAVPQSKAFRTPWWREQMKQVNVVYPIVGANGARPATMSDVAQARGWKKLGDPVMARNFEWAYTIAADAGGVYVESLGKALASSGGHGCYLAPIMAMDLATGDVEVWQDPLYDTSPAVAPDGGYWMQTNPRFDWQFVDGYAGDIACEAPAGKMIADWRAAGRPFPISIRRGETWLVIPKPVKHGIVHRSGAPVPRMRYNGTHYLPGSRDADGIDRIFHTPNYMWFFHGGLGTHDVFADGASLSLFWQDIASRQWGVKADVFPPECYADLAWNDVPGWGASWTCFDDEAIYYFVSGGNDPARAWKLDLTRGMRKASCTSFLVKHAVGKAYVHQAEWRSIALSGYGAGARLLLKPNDANFDARRGAAGIYVINLATNQAAYLFEGVDAFNHLMWCKPRQTVVNLAVCAAGRSGDPANNKGQWKLSTLVPPRNPADWANESRWILTQYPLATADSSVREPYPFDYEPTFRNPRGRVFYEPRFDCVIYALSRNYTPAGYAIRPW